MLLERYYDDSLAQASYIIACERTRETIVIDANMLETHEHALARHRLRITYVTETHIHADYLSGSRALAREHGATLLLSGHGGRDWSYADAEGDRVRLLRDGDEIRIGQVRLDVMHVPGHTPEHLAFLVTDLAKGDRPVGMISGDFLFVGDVGRPDLLEKAAKVAGTMEASARQLFASLQRLTSLPDHLQVWPGHGAGSACGKSLSPLAQSTLGYERLYNPALQHKTEDAFVRWVLADQPEPPPYFAVMKRWNRDGAPAGSAGDDAAWLTARDIEETLAQGGTVVDVRRAPDFAREHMAGSINIPMSRSFVTYAGTVLDYERPLTVVVADDEQGRHVSRQLALIGLRAGLASTDAVREVKSRGKVGIAALQTLEAPALADRMRANGLRVIDVRGRSEWDGGHLPGARHIWLGDLAAAAAKLRRDEPIVVHCQTGARSAIAASMLRARGFTDVTDFPGGFMAWRKAGLPISTDEP